MIVSGELENVIMKTLTPSEATSRIVQALKSEGYTDIASWFETIVRRKYEDQFFLSTLYDEMDELVSGPQEKIQAGTWLHSYSALSAACLFLESEYPSPWDDVKGLRWSCSFLINEVFKKE